MERGMQAFSARTIFFKVLLILSLPPALAADVKLPSPDAAVNQYGTTTYLDLARHFVPDIKHSDDGYIDGYIGKQRIPIRHIAGKDFENSDATEFGFDVISAVTMHADGKERLLVLFHFAKPEQAPKVAVLALYDATKEIKLLDAADIGIGQMTYFFEQAVMPVAPGSDIILTNSADFNSSQIHMTLSMIMVRDDRLQLIDTASLFMDRICTAERLQDIRYAADPDPAKPYAPISVFVTEITNPTNADCGDEKVPPLGTKEFRVTYIWDGTADKYVADSDALQKLAKANEQRF
jgi:hypothetical protein